MIDNRPKKVTQLMAIRLVNGQYDTLVFSFSLFCFTVVTRRG